MREKETDVFINVLQPSAYKVFPDSGKSLGFMKSLRTSTESGLCAFSMYGRQQQYNTKRDWVKDLTRLQVKKYFLFLGQMPQKNLISIVTSSLVNFCQRS